MASFTERSVWIQLSGLALTLGAYFAVAGSMLLQGVTAMTPFVILLGVATVVMVIWCGIGHAAAAILERPEPADERDRLIEWRSSARSAWLLATGVFAAMTALAVGVPGVWVAHLLLVALFATEMLRLSLQLYHYRRGV